MDHDPRFKTLIREFFADFLRLFFAYWAERFDLDTIEWLDKKLLPNPPDGTRHHLDLVGKLRAKEPIASAKDLEPWLVLVHIEIESADHKTVIEPRLPSYYIHLRDEYGLPVLPIVIYLKIGLNGIGVATYKEEFWKLTPLTFQYLYVGLSDLDAVQYVKGENWLGVALAALMRIPKDEIVGLGAEAYRRIAGAPLNDQQKFLLQDCMEAYMPFDEEQRQAYERWVQETPDEKVKAMNKTTYEKGFDKGTETTTQNNLIRLGNKRFGTSSHEVESRIRSIREMARLEELLDRVLDVRSWDELLKNG